MSVGRSDGRLPLPRVSRRRRPSFLVSFRCFQPKFREICMRTLFEDRLYTGIRKPKFSRTKKHSRLGIPTCTRWEQNQGSAAGYMYFGSRTGGAQPVTCTLGAEPGEHSRLQLLLWGQNRGRAQAAAGFTFTFRGAESGSASETRNFRQLSLRCSASCEATQIEQISLTKFFESRTPPNFG